MLAPEQLDEHFSGFLSGHETTMFLNSKRLYIKIQLPSRQILYESTIQYNSSDPVYLQVKKVFTNLDLLFQYINEYCEDIQRIRVDFNKLHIKIVKNQGPRRLKKSPILYIPIKKIIVYQTKPQTKLQIDVQTAINYNQILRCKFQYQKTFRNQILNQYNHLQNQIHHLIKSNPINLSLFQHLLNQRHSLFTQENRQKPTKINSNSLEHSLEEKELEKILLESQQKPENHVQESLFFEDESLQNPVPRTLSQIKLSPKIDYEEKSHNLQLQDKSLTSDPFSYLF